MKGQFMKKYAKKLSEYDHIEIDTEAIIKAMRRLKGSRRRATSVSLEEDVLIEIKSIAEKKGIPYQVLMRLLLTEGLRRLKVS